MTDINRIRKRSASAYKLDFKIIDLCQKKLLAREPISARSIAKALGIATSSITRDTARSKTLSDAKRQQQALSETIKTQTKTSRQKDAETIAKQKVEIEDLKRRNQILLASHKALYNVIREVGGAEAYQRFFETALEARQELIEVGVLEDSIETTK